MVPDLEVEVQQDELLRSLQSLLEYHRGSGIGPYPKNEDIVKFLSINTDLRTNTPSPRICEKPVNSEAIKGALNVAGPVIFQPVVTLAEISAEVAVCRACNLAGSRLATRAGRGGGRVRLLVVGEWLTGTTETLLTEDVQFGNEEDLMLTRMLAAINIQPDETFITNVIKCVVPETTKPVAENARICLSFLHRQIALLAPDCICTMGMMAARALLNLPQPLSQLRGRFQSLRSDDGRQIPVMATYHPSFLLRNPEMKKAVWLDLQEIGRLLKTLS